MPSWGKNKNAVGSAPAFLDKMIGYKKTADAFANTTHHSVDAIPAAEVGGKGIHTGWVYTTRGTGGRAGRVQREVLVALTSVANTGV